MKKLVLITILKRLYNFEKVYKFFSNENEERKLKIIKNKRVKDIKKPSNKMNKIKKKNSDLKEENTINIESMEKKK